MIRERPRIAVIVPSLKGDTKQLEQALVRQTWKSDEVYVVRGVRPNGLARNQGVSATSSEFLVFIDDDALPGSPDLIERVLSPLVTDESIGVTGTARILPPDASWFQHRVSIEIPRTVNPVPDKPMETNPPLRGYGHSLITTTCCAIRRETYLEARGFREDLISGVDTDFFYRVRKLGYRFLMVPKTFVLHPAPDNLRALMRKYHWYGWGYGQEARYRPEQGIGPKLPSKWHQMVFLVIASLWLIPNFFFLYSLSYPRFEFGFRPLKALSTYAVAWGYVNGWNDVRTSG